MKQAVLVLIFMLTVSALCPEALSQSVRPHAGMLRYPDVGPESIVFVYANDLWLVPRAGGRASPLASPPGTEAFPRFSPDGRQVAFMGNYDGNRDLYTLPVEGGVPFRVTYHPGAEVLSDWTPGGELMFFGSMASGIRAQTRLFRVAATGGLPREIPVGQAAFGTMSPDETRLAFTPHTRDQRTWKRYMGGLATDVWLFDLEDGSAERITDWRGTDTIPMWHGDRVYYLSDSGPEHRLNIWCYDTGSKKHRQVTELADFDVKWPSIGPGEEGRGEIVFQYGSSLCLLDLGDEKWRTVDVVIPGARPTLRAQRTDVKRNIMAWDVSSTGKRAAAEARGDIWTLPAEHGIARNLTRTSGAAERYPSWSPDGRWVAYFSDASGEYDLYITQSDGKGETRRLTEDATCYRFAPTWSPNSKMITFVDKAQAIYLHDLEAGTTKLVDSAPSAFGGRPSVSWSHDGRWITFARPEEGGLVSSVWIHEVESGKTRRVTRGVFNDTSPVFDRKGDYLFFASSRHFSPRYSDVDTTFIYAGSQVLLAVPLRADMTSPWAPKVDEETWEDEKKKDEEGKEKKKEGEETAEGGSGEKGRESEEKKKPAEAAKDDGVSGVWEGTLTGPEPIPAGGVPITISLALGEGGDVTGSLSIPMGTVTIDSGRYDAATKEITASATDEDGMVWKVRATISGESMSGTAVNAMVGTAEFEVKRTSKAAPAGEVAGGADKKAREKVEIDFEGFERRAIQLPVKPGRFGNLAVNHKNALLYARYPVRGAPGAAASIKIFDITAEKKEEKDVTAGGGFAMSGDGKKILVPRGTGAAIMGASAGATGKNVVTDGMVALIDPREEWHQIFVDAWRLERDFFYDDALHGVDWERVRDHYAAMLDDCATRSDVGYVIREMISELNVGHAYYRGGPGEAQPGVSVGLLGADFELDQGAYRIARIHEGGPWDSDARGPLSQPGVDVSEGDYLLAVNGLPVDATLSPWAATQGLAGKATVLTVSKKPVLDDEAREVIVEPLGSERNLRYRAWIEANRAYVAEKTDGRVGYIYVPNTGVNGQNDLFRQFVGQIHKQALIIDERWNGGGQIPTRFIELLNRPVTNYWAVRHGGSLAWPPDAHHGPKCMLINEHAGSGGDAFPAYFRQAGLGKLIGTRTWGGLVGYSGGPRLIDGASVTCPSFAFFEKDGTWGIEGHGVDPDIEVVADPALLAKGKDPQLDAAITQMLGELERHPPRQPKRPASPNRAGMGITDADR